MVVMFELFRKSEANYHVNPRFRAYGKARIDIAQRAATRDDWDRLWKKSTYPFPFSWGSSWKQCVEYKVADFPAEVGFFIDILGFPVNAFDPDYAMFTSPSGEFFFSVVPVLESEKVTPPDAFRLQFMVDHIMETAAELERRGVKFEQWPTRSSEKSPLLIGSFHTPNGIGIDLWGIDLELDSQDQLLHSAMKEEDTGNLPTGKPVNLVEEQEIEEGSDLQQDEDHIFDSTSVDNDSEEVEYLPNEDL
jgi:catechol 2,3-dioxygenase-like lactoylglutathione lyase family enzyme